MRLAHSCRDVVLPTLLPHRWLRAIGALATLVYVDDPARLRIPFPCQHEGCLRAAAIVEVSRRGQLYINDEQDIIYRVFPDAQGTIRIIGFLPYTSFASQVPEDRKSVV